MRAKTVVVSLAIHAGVAILALAFSSEPKKRRATSVAVVDQQKEKKPEPPKPPPPAVPPPPPRASAPPRSPQASVAPAPVEAADSGDPGPSTEGPGLAVLPAPPKLAAPSPAEEPKAKVLERPKAERPQADDACTEPATKPEPVSKTPIEYTAQARADGVEGRLVLRVTVAADGSVTDVTVVASVEPSLDAAAIASVRQWRFKPAARCGKPFAGGTYTLARRFELGD